MIHLTMAHTHVMMQFLKIQLWKNNIFNTIPTLSTLQGGGGGVQELRNDVLTTYKVIHSSQKVFREGRKFFAVKSPSKHSASVMLNNNF